ncbi:MAG: MBL fold metallo-hydrolase [Eubacteriales bacterium]|nr:MBL fold metallo-hydrolase [Eubacteriales bacterium]
MSLIAVIEGMLASNTYIIGQKGGCGAAVDAGADTGEIIKVLDREKIELKYILLTHAHLDHIVSMDRLREKTGARILIHEDDAPLLSDPVNNGAMLFGRKDAFKAPDILVKDGDTLDLGEVVLNIIHTPGHTPGGICILCGDKGLLFTGDTLFKLSVGRTDLGNGNSCQLGISLKKIIKLPDDTVVYPGHGEATTIGYERQRNPYLKTLLL